MYNQLKGTLLTTSLQGKQGVQSADTLVQGSSSTSNILLDLSHYWIDAIDFVIYYKISISLLQDQYTLCCDSPLAPLALVTLAGSDHFTYIAPGWVSPVLNGEAK